MITPLENLEVLQLAEEIADGIWQFVSTWNSFAKKTVGMQMVRSADSIGANIAEAYGRYHYGEKLQFLYYARGSLFKTKYWINRGAARNLIPSDIAKSYADKLSDAAYQLNSFAKSIKTRRQNAAKGKKLSEDRVEYTVDNSDDNPMFTEEEIVSLSSIFNLKLLIIKDHPCALSNGTTLHQNFK